MSKRFFSCLMIFMTLLIFAGCTNTQSVESPPDEGLVEFLPANTIRDKYMGDGGYYHIIENVERTNTSGSEIAILNGEVKDTSVTVTNANFDFQIVLTVDDEKMVQTYTGPKLNESNFTDLILLKSPLEVGNTWTFKTKDLSGNKWKVTGEITEIDEIGNVITVKHSTKDGYYEERRLQKGRGVTDFTRLFVFKNERTSTGYQVEKRDIASHIESSELPVDALKIPVAYYNLLLGFEQAWPSYVKQENDDLMQFISIDSPAFEKVKAVSRDATTAIEFVRFYPYELSEEDSMLTIKVVEIFKTVDAVTIENKTRYQIVIEKGIAKIYDFEMIQ